jgi:hypothetical protein
MYGKPVALQREITAKIKNLDPDVAMGAIMTN